MFSARWLLALSAAAILLAGCGGVDGSASDAGGSTAASVNGEPILRSAIEKRVRARIASLPGQDAAPDQRAEQVSRLQAEILSQLIVLEIVDQEADARGITVTDQEIQDEWDEQLALQGGEEALRQAIATAGLTEAEARSQLAVGIKLRKLQELLTGGEEVTDEEVRELYEQRSDQWEQADVSHILVPTEEEARELIRQLDEGASFEELAEEHSDDPGSSARGGNLGLFPRGRYVEEFDEAVWAAEAGEIVGPVQTQFGWHVIRVNEFVHTTFDEVAESLRGEIERGRAEETAQAVFQELIREADVDVAGTFGTWDPASGRVVVADILGPQRPVAPTNQG